MKPVAPRAGRYALAALGPAGMAGAQFLLSLQLFHVLSPEAFGAFSVLLVLSQLTLGFSSALLCAPFPVMLARSAAASEVHETYFSANAIFGLVAFIAFCAVCMIGMNFGPGRAAAFAAGAALTLIRWFGRAYHYAHDRQFRAIASDLVGGSTLLASIALMQWWQSASIDWAFAALIASALAGTLTLGREYLVGQVTKVTLRGMRRYGEVWRRYSGWAFSGVLTTEGTGNAHAYIVTSIRGPAEFAPLAAATLLSRPVGLMMNALTDFERPRLASALARGDIRAAAASLPWFRSVLLGSWVANVLLALLVVKVVPEIALPSQYDPAVLLLCGAIWMLVALVRVTRMPESALLQAAGEFKALAIASYVSCAVSLTATIVLTLSAGSVWSILGIGLGELTYALMIFRQAARWKGKALA